MHRAHHAGRAELAFGQQQRIRRQAIFGVADAMAHSQALDPASKLGHALGDQRVHLARGGFGGNQTELARERPIEVVAGFAERVERRVCAGALQRFGQTRGVHDAAARFARIRENADGYHGQLARARATPKPVNGSDKSQYTARSSPYSTSSRGSAVTSPTGAHATPRASNCAHTAETALASTLSTKPKLGNAFNQRKASTPGGAGNAARSRRAPTREVSSIMSNEPHTPAMLMSLPARASSVSASSGKRASWRRSCSPGAVVAALKLPPRPRKVPRKSTATTSTCPGRAAWPEIKRRARPSTD